MSSMKRQKDMTLKDEPPRSVRAQYATGRDCRNNTRMNEEMEPKWKQYPVVDVPGDGSRVWCCKEQYCILTSSNKTIDDTCTSPDGQYWNQTDYILRSQIWRNSIQSVKTKNRRWTVHRIWGERPWRDRVWGEGKLAKMACSGSLTPCFVNNDYEIADIIYSTVHAHRKVLTWSWVTMCSTPVWAPPKKVVALLLYHSCVCWVSHKRREHSVSTATASVSARREVVLC